MTTIGIIVTMSHPSSSATRELVLSNGHTFTIGDILIAAKIFQEENNIDVNLLDFIIGLKLEMGN